MNPTARRQQLLTLLGDLPPFDQPITATLVATREAQAAAPAEQRYRVEHLLLDLNGIEPVPAYFVRPLANGLYPTILYNHAHGNNYTLGKEELLTGRAALQRPSYAEALTAQGYAALCLDAWNFGQRQQRTESALFKEMLWQGQVLWGMMVYDSLRAIDYLQSRADVAANRIGTLGLSMGSTMAWWIAALDARIKVCIDICCLTDFEALIATQGLDGHGIYYYVPGLLKQFSTADINALIAPRPHLSLAGDRDPLTPAAGLDRIDQALKAVYAAHDASAAWQLYRANTGHVETAVMRQKALSFLHTWL